MKDFNYWVGMLVVSGAIVLALAYLIAIVAGW